MRRSTVVMSVLIGGASACSSKGAPISNAASPLAVATVTTVPVMSSTMATGPSTVATSTPTTVSSSQVESRNPRDAVLVGFERYVLARRTGDPTGGEGPASFRLSEARSASTVEATSVWVNGANAAIRACSDGEERLLLLTLGSGERLSVVQVLSPSTADWCGR